MMEIKISLDDKAFEPLNEVPVRFAKDIDSVIQLSAMDIRNIIVRNINSNERTGRIYKRRSVTHQASAPGEWPKTDTGRLVGSIRTNFSFLSAEIGSDVTYSKFLQDGTKFMKPRPWLTKGYEESIPNIQKNVNDLLKRVFKIL